MYQKIESKTEQKLTKKINMKATAFDANEIHFDGTTTDSNPSPIGGGYVLCDRRGKIVAKKTIKQFNMTNNEAELLGAFAAVKVANCNGTVVTDSECTVCWVRSRNPKARPELKHLCRNIHELMKMKGVNMKWVPREQNMAGQIIEASQNIHKST